MVRAYHELQSVTRAARVLLAFQSAEEWSISTLARELDLHKSVVHRLVTTLVASGLLTRDPRHGSFRLGAVFAQLGPQVDRSGNLHRVARPYLQQLVQRFGETVSLHVIQGDHGLCIDRLEGPGSPRITLSAGQSFPLHAGCAGKVMLAFRDEAFVERLLSNTPLQRYTEFTVTDARTLWDELALIRQRGVGFSDSEVTPGVKAVATPIMSGGSVVVGSLAISGSAARMTQAKMEAQAEALLASAAELSLSLGHPRVIQETAEISASPKRVASRRPAPPQSSAVDR